MDPCRELQCLPSFSTDFHGAEPKKNITSYKLHVNKKLFNVYLLKYFLIGIVKFLVLLNLSFVEFKHVFSVNVRMKRREVTSLGIGNVTTVPPVNQVLANSVNKTFNVLTFQFFEARQFILQLEKPKRLKYCCPFIQYRFGEHTELIVDGAKPRFCMWNISRTSESTLSRSHKVSMVA